MNRSGKKEKEKEQIKIIYNTRKLLVKGEKKNSVFL